MCQHTGSISALCSWTVCFPKCYTKLQHNSSLPRVTIKCPKHQTEIPIQMYALLCSSARCCQNSSWQGLWVMHYQRPQIASGHNCQNADERITHLLICWLLSNLINKQWCIYTECEFVRICKDHVSWICQDVTTLIHIGIGGLTPIVTSLYTEGTPITPFSLSYLYTPTMISYLLTNIVSLLTAVAVVFYMLGCRKPFADIPGPSPTSWLYGVLFSSFS